MTVTTDGPAGLAFCDTETVTLEPGWDVIWEVAVILRDAKHDDEEWRWQLRPNLDRANEDSLRISRFYRRFEIPDDAPDAVEFRGEGREPLTLGDVAARLATMLRGRHIVGAVPNFDTERLSLFLAAHGECGGGDPWHYHLVDVENLAVGWLYGMAAHAHRAGVCVEDLADPSVLAPPWDSNQLAALLGVQPPTEEARHTALGDARMARDLWDAVTGQR